MVWLQDRVAGGRARSSGGGRIGKARKSRRAGRRSAAAGRGARPSGEAREAEDTRRLARRNVPVKFSMLSGAYLLPVGPMYGGSDQGSFFERSYKMKQAVLRQR